MPLSLQAAGLFGHSEMLAFGTPVAFRRFKDLLSSFSRRKGAFYSCHFIIPPFLENNLVSGIGQHALEIVHPCAADAGGLPELALPLRRLKAELVAAAAVIHLDFAGSGGLEAFGRCLLRLDFSHFSLFLSV